MLIILDESLVIVVSTVDGAGAGVIIVESLLIVVESVVVSVDVVELSLQAIKNAEAARTNNTFFILFNLVFYDLFQVYTIK